eukprot:SAG11_NODE_2391_length_3412_cov_1.952309_1_plen_42_part_10
MDGANLVHRSSSNLGGSNPPTPNYPKNHVKKIHPVYRGSSFV